MSNGTNPGGSAVTPSVLAFGAAMLALGLVLGYMLAPGQQATAPATAPPPVASANKVINKTGGELRKLNEQEKRELTRKSKTAEPPQAPADSVYLGEAITGSFSDPLLLTKYRQVVGFMSRGNARAASSLLTELASQSKGKAWREQVTALLAEAQAATSKTQEARATITTFKGEYPKSAHMATVVLAEGRSWMQDGKRSPGAGKGGEISAPQREMYGKAIGFFDDASSRWPEDDAAAEALFNKAALLGELGQIADAEGSVYSLVDRFPGYRNSARALSNLGRTAASAGDGDRAEAAYEKLIATFPKDRMAAGARSSLSSLRLVGKAAPGMQIGEWIGDDPGTLADLEGKPVLLVFWATWCPHCRREMPRIEEIWQRFKDDGLVIVGVTKNSRGQTTDKVREYIGENGLTLPIGIDSTGGTSKSYSVSGIPAAALIDKSGKVVVRDHPTRITDEVIKQYL
jgi:thiol-disulfide isomerase/thioredoxin